MKKSISLNEKKGVIYIIVNSMLPKQSKVGYAEDAEKVVNQLNKQGMFKGAYSLYATYETAAVADDKQVYKLFATLNDDISIVEVPEGRNTTSEYYVIKPDEAYRLLLTIARISGTQDNLKKYTGSTAAVKEEKEVKPKAGSKVTRNRAKRPTNTAAKTAAKATAKVETVPETAAEKEKRTRKPNLKFSDYKIPIGSMLEYVKDKSKKVKVVGEREVEYNGDTMSMSECAKRLLNSKSGVPGTNYFSYKGKPLCDIRRELGI